MFRKIVFLGLTLLLLVSFSSCNNYYNVTKENLAVGEISNEVFDIIEFKCSENSAQIKNDYTKDQIKDIYDSLKLNKSKVLTPKYGIEEYLGDYNYITVSFSAGVEVYEQYGYFVIYENDIAYQSLSSVIEDSHYVKLEKGTYKTIYKKLKKYE